MLPAIYCFVAFELFFVSWGDLKRQKIPNYWSLLNLTLFVAFVIFIPDYYKLTLESFSFSIAFLVVGFFLFLTNIMGGGDSKFLATFFLIVPLSLQEELFYYLILSTLIIGGLFFLKSVVLNFRKLYQALIIQDVQTVKKCFGGKFPYAPVIMFSWVWLGYSLYLKN